MKMISRRVIVTSLMLCIVTCVWCQQPGTKKIEDQTPTYDGERTQKMMEIAVIKIITGNLSTQDMQLLKSLGYSEKSVMAVRKQELEKKRAKYVLDAGKEMMLNGSKYEMIPNDKTEEKRNQAINYDRYNHQAVLDYENAVNTTVVVETISDYEDPSEEEMGNEDDDRNNSGNPLKPIVIFKIRFNDTDLNPNSEEKSQEISIPLTTIRPQSNYSESSTPMESSTGSGSHDFENLTTNNYTLSVMMQRAVESQISKIPHASSDITVNRSESRPNPTTLSSSTTAQYASSRSSNENPQPFRSSDHYSTVLPIVYHLSNLTAAISGNDSSNQDTMASSAEKNLVKKSSTVGISSGSVDKNIMKIKDAAPKRISEYKGLEWVEDDVYRVIPEALNYDINNMDEENETMATEYHSLESSMGKLGEDYFGYQGDSKKQKETTPRNVNGTTTQWNGNSTEYQLHVLQFREIQKKQALENIRKSILIFTNRTTDDYSRVRREPLTMIPPMCPTNSRNRDDEAWSDPFSMNLHFQVNLTDADHVMEARLRIYILPQNNTAVSNSSVNDLDRVINQKEKIKISVYFHSKSQKKHGTKKTFVDSEEVSLSSEGMHLALDSRKALRLWRQTPRPSHVTESHPLCGLVIQVEDQRGRSLKPALYIQQDTCHTNPECADEKAYQRIRPQLYIQACSRYVRFENGREVTYVNCKNHKKNRH